MRKRIKSESNRKASGNESEGDRWLVSRRSAGRRSARCRLPGLLDVAQSHKQRSRKVAHLSLVQDERPRVVVTNCDGGEGTDMPRTTQLRTYTIRDGLLDEWVRKWRDLVVPLRLELGFEIGELGSTTNAASSSG